MQLSLRQRDHRTEPGAIETLAEAFEENGDTAP
jgi:hypothetical protein